MWKLQKIPYQFVFADICLFVNLHNLKLTEPGKRLTKVQIYTNIMNVKDFVCLFAFNFWSSMSKFYQLQNQISTTSNLYVNTSDASSILTVVLCPSVLTCVVIGEGDPHS